MEKICIVTQDINIVGGVYSKLLLFLECMSADEFICDIYYPVTTSEINNQKENELFSISCVSKIIPVYIPSLLRVPHFILGITFYVKCKFQEKYTAHYLISGSYFLGLPFIKNDLECSFVTWVAGSHMQLIKGMPRKKLRHYYYYNFISNYLAHLLEKIIIKNAAINFVDSNYSVKYVCNEFCVTTDKIVALPIPLTSQEFTPKKNTCDNKYILCVARLEREKDIETLLNAFCYILRKEKNISLKIVGNGQEKYNLEKIAKNRGIDSKVSFLGEKFSSELIDLYRNAYMFILPSRQETFGIVIIEAMSCGLPVITTDSGGPGEIVLDGITGFVVPIGDAERMADSAIILIRDKALWKNMSRCACSRVEEKYSLKSVCDAINKSHSKFFK